MILSHADYSLITYACSMAQRGSLPILEHALIKANGGGPIHLASTNLETQIRATVADSDPDSEPAAFTMNAGKFIRILKSLDADADTQIGHDATRQIATLRSGRSRWEIPTLPATDWPEFKLEPATDEILLRADELIDAIGITLPAAGIDDARYYLNSLLIELGSSSLCVVGTDSHRLHQTTAALDSGPIERQIILPRRTAENLLRARLMGDLAVRIGHNSIGIASSAIEVTSKLIESKYPDWRCIMPRPKYQLQCRRADLIRAIERCMILADEKYQGVAITFDANALTLQGQSKASGVAEAIIECEAPDKAMTIGFCGRYLRDGLAVLTGEHIILGYTDPNSGCLLQDAGSEGPSIVVMPMRL